MDGIDNLSQLSPALMNNKHDLVKFHEYMLTCPEYKPNKSFTCGPFKDSEEWNVDPNGPTRYNINEYGFRGEWNLDLSRKIRIAVFGDSCTFGVGVDEEDTFVQHLNKMYPSYSLLNFGMVGSSIENIAKCYSVAKRVIEFDFALMLLPDHGRFCWPVYNHPIWQHTNLLPGPGLDPNNKEHLDYFKSNNELLESNRTINYLNWINDIAIDKTLSIWSWSKETNNIIEQVMPESVFANIDPKIVETDHARDHQHPGPKTHKRIAEYWYESLEF